MNNNHSGDRYLRSLGLRPAQDSDALAAQLRQAVGDAQAEAALSALYTRRTQQETATSGLDRQETAAFYDRKNQHPQASLILSAATTGICSARPASGSPSIRTPSAPPS